MITIIKSTTYMTRSIYNLLAISILLTSCGHNDQQENNTSIIVNKPTTTRIDSTLKSFVNKGMVKLHKNFRDAVYGQYVPTNN